MQKLISSFIEYIRTEKGYSAHTIRNYVSDLRQFSHFVATWEGVHNGDPSIELVDYKLIRAYLGELFAKCRRTTIARKLSALKSFFKYLELRGLASSNPSRDRHTQTRKVYPHIPPRG